MLAEAAARAEELARTPGNERELATLRAQWDDELEAAARDRRLPRARASRIRAIAQFRFRQKLELLRRGLEDESAAARGSALDRAQLAVGGSPRRRQRVTGPLLNELAARDPNDAVRRLAIPASGTGPADRGTIQLLEGIARRRRERPRGSRRGPRGRRRCS